MSVLDEIFKKVPGFIEQQELHLLYKLAQNVQHQHVIVEIGSYQGMSTCALAAGSKDGRRSCIFAVDLWRKGNDLRYNTESVYNGFKNNIKSFGFERLVTQIEDFSENVVNSWVLPVGLLFIDGNHEYNSVKSDFENWSKFLVPNGLVAFHDYCNPKYPLITGVQQFVDEEMRQNKKWEYKTLIESTVVFSRKGGD